MNQSVRSYLYYISAISVLAGSILYFFSWNYAPWLFAFGTAGLTVCYLTEPMKDLDFRQKRLHRNNVFAGLLMIFASGFMFNDKKEWVIFLTVAAILQLYSAFVMNRKKE